MWPDKELAVLRMNSVGGVPSSAGLALAVCSAGFLAGLTVLLLSPLMIRLAGAFGLHDHPLGRKNHGRPVPRLGGVAITVGIACGYLAGSALTTRSAADDFAPFGFGVLSLLGVLLVALTGLVDDVHGLSAMRKLVLQVAAAALVVGSGLRLEVVEFSSGEIHLGVLGDVVTLIWIVGVTNAMNLVDGLDGLAAGVAAIIGGTFLFLALLNGNVGAALLAASLVGASVGFLPHNWEPAKSFMGDCGALTLGFLLAALSISTAVVEPPTVSALLVPVIALGVPVFDTVMVIVGRLSSKPNVSFWKRCGRVLVADRSHLHHRLEGLLPSARWIVVTVYLLVLVSCLLSLALAFAGDLRFGFFLMSVEALTIFWIRMSGFRRTRWQERDVT